MRGQYDRDDRQTAQLSGDYPEIAELLGHERLRHHAALRHGGRGWYIPSSHYTAQPWRAPVGRSLCAAFAPPDRRALCREPQPLAALLPVSGANQTQPARSSGALSWIA